MPSVPNTPNASGISPPMVYVRERILWEYKCVTRKLPADNFPTEKELNEFGREGWELAGTVCDSGLLYLYFKRMKD